MIIDDIKRGSDGESRVKTILELMGHECEFNTDRKSRSYFDLRINGRETIEIKNDFYASKSGNVAIEYYNPRSNKPSGINITQSDIWCHIIDEEMFVVRTDILREFVDTEEPKRVIKRAGDGNASLKLFAIEHIMKIFIPISRIGEIL